MAPTLPATYWIDATRFGEEGHAILLTILSGDRKNLESYDMFMLNGILLNRESPRRGQNFVTRKITLGASATYLGIQDNLILGNLEANRGWSYAKDFVEAMWLML